MNSEIPTITTDRLILRPFAAEDARPMQAILAGEDVLRYFPGSEPPPLEGVLRMIARIDESWANRGYGLWAVTSRSSASYSAATSLRALAPLREPATSRTSRELLGRCGLQYLPDSDEVEVDFILGRPYWGQGFATEAGRAALNFGFETLGIDLIVGIVHPENLASQRVLEKLGLGGRRRTRYFGMDVYRYEISSHAGRPPSADS